MNSDTLLFIFHLMATSVMVCVIWYVQLIRYPLFSQIPPNQFTRCHHAYTARIGWIAIPAMAVELVTGIILMTRTAGHTRIIISAGMFVLMLVWISTVMVQAPYHNILSRGYQAGIHRRLISSNWFRTIGWTLRWLLTAAASMEMLPE